MIPRATVGEIMTSELIVVKPVTALQEAVDLLLENRISGLPVVGEDGALVGILTEQDCLRAAYRRDYYQQPSRTVAEAMSREVTTIEATANVVTAMELFLNHPFRRLPVVDNGRLVGLISRRDALRALRSSY